MSYYDLRSDQDKQRASAAQRSRFLRTPPASTGPQQMEYQWGSQPTTSYGPRSMPTTYGWQQPTQPHGLGLMQMPHANNGDDIYSQATTTAESLSAPFAWPSEFASTQQHSMFHPNEMHWDQYNETFNNPQSTMMPSALWTQSPVPSMPLSGAMPYDASPSVSSYTNSSLASTMSSPHAVLEARVKTAGSPRIKVESTSGMLTPAMYALPERPYLGQSFAVAPEDLTTNYPGTMDTRREVSLPSSIDASFASESEDFKATFHPREHLHGNTSSFEDLRQHPFEDRQKRGFTKPENASCVCDLCGKLFQRSYNLKAHMETHNQHRNQPHQCEYPDCDKRFVRKTDLQRHEQSVHLKTRNHSCPYCDSSFSRKDTLRRHVEDGCPRRPEVKKRTNKAGRSPNSGSASSSRRPSHQ